jgi:DNA repair protein RadA/Sms
MAKNKTVYICQSCSYQTLRWVGQCPECQSWNTFVEEVITKTLPNQSKSYSNVNVKLIKLSEVKYEESQRFSSGFSEFDRVLGGGFVAGQVILMAGEPGIGKSTILTQICRNLSKDKIIYVCGEENPEQIKLRAERLKVNTANLYMLTDTDVDQVLGAIEQNPDTKLLIVDSMQTITSQEFMGIAGSVGQVRGCVQKISDAVKRLNISTIIIGHVTKEGTVAGPKVLEHMVDTVLYLEGDHNHLFRVLKTIKNRFGPVSEIGLFEMAEEGLKEVLNPSEMFLSERSKTSVGSCVSVVMEGFRPLMFEIQALTSKTTFGYPMRKASGFNVNRLQLLIAILEKKCKIDLSQQDVFVNVAGGFKVAEYGVDLAVCMALLSSYHNKNITSDLCAFGECGLLGEIRRVSQMDKRISEAKKLGFKKIVSPNDYKNIADLAAELFPKNK